MAPSETTSAVDFATEIRDWIATHPADPSTLVRHVYDRCEEVAGKFVKHPIPSPPKPDPKPTTPFDPGATATRRRRRSPGAESQ